MERPKPAEVIRRGLSSFTTRVKVATKVSGIRFHINQLKTQKRDILQDIGERVYLLFKKGKVGNPEVTKLCKRVEEIEEEISQGEREIERIREEAELGEKKEIEVSQEPLEKEEGG